MTIVMLTPRERERFLQQVPPDTGGGANADLLRTLRGRLQQTANTAEIELTHSDVLQIQKARQNWRAGYERQFDALLQALARHNAV